MKKPRKPARPKDFKHDDLVWGKVMADQIRINTMAYMPSATAKRFARWLERAADYCSQREAKR